MPCWCAVPRLCSLFIAFTGNGAASDEPRSDGGKRVVLLRRSAVRWECAARWGSGDPGRLTVARTLLAATGLSAGYAG